MALNPMSTRTTIIQSDGIAAAYRNRHPLPPLQNSEPSNVKENTKLLSIYGIDTTIRPSVQRALLEDDDYIELAILGAEAFLAVSERLGVSRALRRFVRRDELPELRKLQTLTSPRLENDDFIADMRSNTGWVDSLLELVATLKPVQGRE